MEVPQEKKSGIIASVRRLLKTVAAIAENRIELFLLEWQEERWRLDTIKMFKLAAKAPNYEKADQVLRPGGRPGSGLSDRNDCLRLAASQPYEELGAVYRHPGRNKEG